MNWGFRIRRYRQQAGLTQEALAELFGVEPRTIQRWECDRHAPPLWVQLRLRSVHVPVAQSLALGGLKTLTQSLQSYSVLIDENCTIVATSAVYQKRAEYLFGADWRERGFCGLLPEAVRDRLTGHWDRHGGYRRMLDRGLSVTMDDYIIPAKPKNGPPVDTLVRGIGTRLFYGTGPGESVFMMTSTALPMDQHKYLTPEFTYLDEIMSAD